MIDIVILEDEFDNAKTIEKQYVIVLRAIAYGWFEDARVLAQRMFKDVNDKWDPKPRSGKHSDKAKPILDLVDEIVYLSKRDGKPALVSEITDIIPQATSDEEQS